MFLFVSTFVSPLGFLPSASYVSHRAPGVELKGIPKVPATMETGPKSPDERPQELSIPRREAPGTPRAEN